MAQSFYFEDELETDLAAQGFALLTLLDDNEDRQHCVIGWALVWTIPIDALCADTAHGARTADNLHGSVGGNRGGRADDPIFGTSGCSIQSTESAAHGAHGHGYPTLINELFAEGNEDVATIRQIALTIAPNVPNT